VGRNTTGVIAWKKPSIPDREKGEKAPKQMPGPGDYDIVFKPKSSAS
jgi:hypothetical protein